VLNLPGAHCRRKAGLRTEVALDGLQLVISKAHIFDVAECFAILGATNVHHKRLVAASKYALQVKPLDKINLCLPALRFEGALTDVVVTGCARKCEVVRQQDVDRVPVLLLPCRIPIADSLVVPRLSPIFALFALAVCGTPPPQPVRTHPPRESSGATLPCLS
jgi:hypothetical protein